jgi:threonine efflux protein
MLNILVTLWLLHVAVLLTPGANLLLVSQLAASDRRGSASFAALGVSVGAGMWAALAVFGVNAVFLAFPGFRLTLQAVGGIYLVYVAARMWRSGVPSRQEEDRPLSAWSAFRVGLLTNATNPKPALFFTSVFAASFPAEPSAPLQAATITLFFANSLGWHLFLAFAFSRQRIRVGYTWNRTLINRLAGAVLGAIGLRLLTVSAAEMKT